MQLRLTWCTLAIFSGIDELMFCYCIITVHKPTKEAKNDTHCLTNVQFSLETKNTYVLNKHILVLLT